MKDFCPFQMKSFSNNSFSLNFLKPNRGFRPKVHLIGFDG